MPASVRTPEQFFRDIVARLTLLERRLKSGSALATTDSPGVVERATSAEVIAGADNERFVTPAGIRDRALFTRRETSANQTHSASGWLTVALADVTAGSGFSYASGGLTFPRTGFYQVSASISWAARTDATGRRLARVATPDGTTVYLQNEVPLAQGNRIICPISAPVWLTAGTVIELQGYSNQTGAQVAGVGSETFLALFLAN